VFCRRSAHSYTWNRGDVPPTSPTSHVAASPTSHVAASHTSRRHVARVTAPTSRRPRHGPHVKVPTPSHGDHAHTAHDPRPVAGTYINSHIDRVGQRPCGNFARFFWLNGVEISLRNLGLRQEAPHVPPDAPDVAQEVPDDLQETSDNPQEDVTTCRAKAKSGRLT
jgi:hypothetical protein